MILDEILLERVNSRDLYDQALDAVFTVLKTSSGDAKDRLENIKSALTTIADKYAAQWKSGIFNARGYEYNKIVMMIDLNFHPNKVGGSFSTRVIDGIRCGRLELHFPHYEAFDEPAISTKFASKFAHLIANSFAHEMIHYTQDVGIGKSLDPNKPKRDIDDAARSRIRARQAVTTAYGEEMTDEKRARYHASINEIDAYAANAASDLLNKYSPEEAKALMKNFSALASASPVIEKFVKFVKDKRPKAWKRFMSQVGWNLDRYSQ